MSHNIPVGDFVIKEENRGTYLVRVQGSGTLRRRLPTSMDAAKIIAREVNKNNLDEDEYKVWYEDKDGNYDVVSDFDPDRLISKREKELSKRSNKIPWMMREDTERSNPRSIRRPTRDMMDRDRNDIRRRSRFFDEDDDFDDEDDDFEDLEYESAFEAKDIRRVFSNLFSTDRPKSLEINGYDDGDGDEDDGDDLTERRIRRPRRIQRKRRMI